MNMGWWFLIHDALKKSNGMSKVGFCSQLGIEFICEIRN